MKALFVLHESKFVYGANRSITELLKNIDYDFDILICKSFTKKINEREIRDLFGKHLKRIYICWLPRYRCYNFDKISIISEFSHFTNNFMAFIYSMQRKRIIKQGDYDYVHLNSIVLFPVIDDNAIYIMHIREIINSDYYNIKKLAEKMEKTGGIICIDEVTKTALEQVFPENGAIILNNPFSMLGLKNVSYEENLRKYGLNAENTIFAMLGQVTENKGARFVIQAFMKQHNEKSRLLIVGNHNHSYGKECEEIAKSDKRIIFCGELKDTTGIYRISDYIIRGDSQFCIGRTIFEGLYAGCGVIVPGCKGDLQSFPEGEKFEEKIIFYPPGSDSGLSDTIEVQARSKQTNRTLHSNVNDYIDRYNRYISKLIGIREE